ncbi:snail family zinc finger 2 transcription factor [Anaeramoeba flamelloides]|uniref:Snail family zinc finger 2 transcription factor n=1 Tax=Anaeramoeba flamelloides TaxID=1746091 RepID=A0ABQ8Y1R0_9EUKA|nr:snail family zinc finger 2 transcription factor [Anaeramoeba flamelloides]
MLLTNKPKFQQIKGTLIEKKKKWITIERLLERNKKRLKKKEEEEEKEKETRNNTQITFETLITLDQKSLARFRLGFKCSSCKQHYFDKANILQATNQSESSKVYCTHCDESFPTTFTLIDPQNKKYVIQFLRKKDLQQNTLDLLLPYQNITKLDFKMIRKILACEDEKLFVNILYYFGSIRYFINSNKKIKELLLRKFLKKKEKKIPKRSSRNTNKK